MSTNIKFKFGNLKILSYIWNINQFKNFIMTHTLIINKAEIVLTTDYSLFSLNEHFKTSKSHLEKIVKSISEKNLCCDYPILVDDDYKILEGKYRFMACYQLNLPIYYKFAEKTTAFDALRLKHITRKSDISEVINFYSHLPNFKNLKLMYEEYNQIIPLRYVIHTALWSNTNKKQQSYIEDFYAGKFINWNIDEFKKCADRVLSLMKYFEGESYKRTLIACKDFFGKNDSVNKFDKHQMSLIRKLHNTYESLQPSDPSRRFNLLSSIYTFNETLEHIKEVKVVYIGVYNSLLRMGFKIKKPVGNLTFSEGTKERILLDKYILKYPNKDPKELKQQFYFNYLKKNPDLNLNLYYK